MGEGSGRSSRSPGAPAAQTRRALPSTALGPATRSPSPGLLTCLRKLTSGKQLLNCDGRAVAGEK